MKPRGRVPPLSEQVVVLTGASSGIGRCTALHLARQGAKVVLTARRAEALEALAGDIREAGGEALAVPGDVKREEDLEAVAQAALARYGRLDTWVNNAAVFIQGRVDDITSEEYRELLDVNLLGYIRGTKVALRVFRERGSGHVIQVSSVLGKHGAESFSAYAAAKAGLDGFTQSLRAELVPTSIRVSTLYLPPVDTPIYRQARGKFGTHPRPPPPVSTPESAARALAALARRPERERTHGVSGLLFLGVGWLPKSLGDWAMHRIAGFARTDEPSLGDDLARPSAGRPRVHDGWARPGLRGLTPGLVTRVLPWESVLGAAAVGLAAGLARGQVGARLGR